MNPRKGTTKSSGQKHAFDKFYTKPEIAKECIDSLDLGSYSLIIEPSAGSGSFSLQIPSVVAFDLYPEHGSIIKQDWLEYEGVRKDITKTLVIGNPPFGQQNTLAIKFINHAATFADTIAFILPKSFMKEGIQKFLNPNLHLRNQRILPKNSFLLHNEEVDVPCIFQIWDYDNSYIRVIHPMPKYKEFKFVNKTDNPDLYIQRIGGNAGKAGLDWQHRSINSTYFIKINSGTLTAVEFINMVNKTSFPSKYFSVGPRSISKKELILALTENNSSLKL